ncbi:MAG: EamA family transporter [Pseudomonadota bacterium]
MSDLLLYLSSVLIWGSTWFAIEFQLGEVSPTVSLFYRYLLAAAVLFGWCLWRGLPLRFGWRAHRVFVLLGLLLFGLNYAAAYQAQFYISSALNAIMFSMLLWLNIINARLIFGTRIEGRVWVGAAFGLLGIVVLFWPELATTGLTGGVMIGVGFSLLGATVASFGNMAAQWGSRQSLPVVQSNAWGMAYGALGQLLFAVLRGDEFVFDSSPAYVISLVYLAVFGSVIAFGTYLTLLGRIGAHRAGYVVVMFPIVALILSALFEGLALTPTLGVGVGLALLGNVLVLRGAKVPAKEEAQ